MRGIFLWCIPADVLKTDILQRNKSDYEILLVSDSWCVNLVFQIQSYFESIVLSVQYQIIKRIREI